MRVGVNVSLMITVLWEPVPLPKSSARTARVMWERKLSSRSAIELYGEVWTVSQSGEVICSSSLFHGMRVIVWLRELMDGVVVPL